MANISPNAEFAVEASEGTVAILTNKCRVQVLTWGITVPHVKFSEDAGIHQTDTANYKDSKGEKRFIWSL